MAVKTITIDMEAYRRLAREKRGKESFSQVIKRILDSRVMTADKLIDRLASFSLSDETLTRIEEVVRERDKSYPEIPKVNQE